MLEVLRQPLESGRIVISRAAQQAEFPARFQLIAAMIPYFSGWAGDPSGRCHCAADQVLRYRARISGPLLDRIDMLIDVPRLDAQTLRQGRGGESSSAVAARVLAARMRQHPRGALNAGLPPAALESCCRLDDGSEQLLQASMERLQLSARSVDRVLRVARTIADLDASETVRRAHLAEALGLRRCQGLA